MLRTLSEKSFVILKYGLRNQSLHLHPALEMIFKALMWYKEFGVTYSSLLLVGWRFSSYLQVIGQIDSLAGDEEEDYHGRVNE
jgi:hypothetical protein